MTMGAARRTVAAAALCGAAALLASCATAPQPAHPPSPPAVPSTAMVARLEPGSAPVAGSLSAPGGAIEVATSADGRYVFMSLEGTGAVQVSDLARALSAGFQAGGVAVGQVPAPLAPVGEAVSPGPRRSA